jgi:RNA polymerase primary sigma factor
MPRAKAGKKAEPAKKGAALVEEEDLSDIEADIEGEVEAEAEVVVDEKEAKAKPLRMKVSRAKERALMREFGLDETTLTEEEATKRRQELKTLIKMGKTRGFLTHQEINDHLPEKLINEEILEAIVSMLNDMGIAVYEQAPDAATLLVAGGGATTATEEEAEEAAEAALSTVDSEFGRTTDPVRMYMREMGTVELLTREGEIEIAKRIEGGLQAMMLAISASAPPPSPKSCPWPTRSAPARCRSPRPWTASSASTKPTTTWPKKTSTSSTKKTTTTARAAARR